MKRANGVKARRDGLVPPFPSPFGPVYAGFPRSSPDQSPDRGMDHDSTILLFGDMCICLCPATHWDMGFGRTIAKFTFQGPWKPNLKAKGFFI